MNGEYERGQKWKSKLQCHLHMVECDSHDEFAEDREYKKTAKLQVDLCQ